MARQLYGTIVWEENPLYSGRTPIIERHAEEVEEYTNKVHDELENHKAENSYDAHKAVTLTESGFITPEIVQEINNLQTTLNDLTSRVNLRIPDGIMFHGTVHQVRRRLAGTGVMVLGLLRIQETDLYLVAVHLQRTRSILKLMRTTGPIFSVLYLR